MLDISQNNTWQGLVITDGTESYAIFIYRCGDMTWAYNPTIGFTAAGSSFANHPNTGSTNAEEIACLNTPLSQWYNLVYQISLPNATNQTSLPTIEPRKTILHMSVHLVILQWMLFLVCIRATKAATYRSTIVATWLLGFRKHTIKFNVAWSHYFSPSCLATSCDGNYLHYSWYCCSSK